MTIRKLRNIGISAHIDSGKTTLTERMLYYCGRINRIGEVRGKDIGAVMDHDQIEKDRGITISSAVTRVPWNGYDINVIDTPGHVDFTVEVERSLRVLDGAVLVLCAVGGVQSQSLTVDRQMKRYGVPRIAFINKMDRAGANPERVIAQLKDKLRANAVALQIPIGGGKDFEAVIDLITMEAVYFFGENGETVVRREIPEDLRPTAERNRSQMWEALSAFDDELMGTLLMESVPSEDKLRDVIRRATIAHQLTPVLMGSAFKNKGVQELLDAVNHYLPAPTDREVYANDTSSKSAQAETPRVKLSSDSAAPVVAMAFKTVVESFGQLTFMRIYQGRIRKGDTLSNARTGRSTRFSRLVRIHAGQRKDIDDAVAGDIIGVIGVDCASGDTFTGNGISCSLENIFVPNPVIRLSIAPKDRDDADKLAKALVRFRRQDPTFQVSTDPQTDETIIAGMGQLHLDVYVERLRDEHKCECEIGPPRVAYKQRPTKSVDFNHKLKKQSGGPGQVGHVIGKMEPLQADAADAESFVFVDEVKGGRIPREYIPSVRQGFAEALNKGPLGEFEVVGVQIVLTDGSYHEQDSSDKSFKDCARQAMRTEILPNADIVLLEPVMKLEIEVPAEFQGAVSGHLSKNRGIVTASETSDSTCVLIAEVPLAEMFDYANNLRSMTQGQGSFSMEFLAYRETPKRVQADVVKNR
ncbi:MAG: elongation factor G [Fuerstiella sp.]|nr:elongation factor G [Fuerstiella sp.]MCP4852934.1 elongation factor G [Fuerstiella sp.]